jgi:hypothetical protein
MMGDNSNKNKVKKPEASKLYFGEQKGDSEEDLEDLDEDQIVNIFKNQGIIKKDKAELQQIQMYQGIACQSAIFLFDKETCFRKFTYKMIKHGLWETAV